MNGHLPYLGVWVVSVICLQLMQSRSTASLSPGLTTATAYWRVCRFASWNGFNQSSILLHVFLYGRTPSDHVTDLLRDILHWLRVPQRITYKLCLITNKAIHNSMPDYITDFCISAADNRLRSSAKILLQVPRSSTKFGYCSFSVAGPTAWNSLPDYVKNASSLESFKSRLKTLLFKNSYDCR